MPVPKSAVKSLSISSSSNSSILNNHPHPTIHNSIHSKYHNDRGKIESQNHGKMAIKPKEIQHIESKNPMSWDFQDDLLLRYLKEVKSLGWKEISRYFSNRTPNACQFRWRRLKSGNLKNNHTISIDINSIDANTLFKNIKKNINHKLSSDLINLSKNNDSNRLLPHLEIMAQNVTDVTIKNNTKENSSNNDGTKLYSLYIDENKNLKPSIPNINDQKNNNCSSGKYNNDMSISDITRNDTSYSGMEMDAVHETDRKEIRKSASSVSIKSFAKPRSFSLNVTRPKLHALKSSSNTLNQRGLDVFQSEEENVGFIPKIIVRSRRSSFNIINNNTNFVIQSNTLLGNDISRRNSTITQSRRPSINLSLNSAVSSRRSSFNMSSDFLDTQLPINNQHCHGNNQNVIHSFTKWAQSEDQLLLDLVNVKKMSLKEVSILLPRRSEEEIKWRYQHLSRDK